MGRACGVHGLIAHGVIPGDGLKEFLQTAFGIVFGEQDGEPVGQRAIPASTARRTVAKSLSRRWLRRPLQRVFQDRRRAAVRRFCLALAQAATRCRGPVPGSEVRKRPWAKIERRC